MPNVRRILLVVPLALALGASAAPVYAASAPKPHARKHAHRHHVRAKPKVVRARGPIGGVQIPSPIPVLPAQPPKILMIAVMPVR